MEMAKNSDDIADSRGRTRLETPKGHWGSMCDVTSVHAAAASPFETPKGHWGSMCDVTSVHAAMDLVITIRYITATLSRRERSRTA